MEAFNASQTAPPDALYATVPAAMQTGLLNRVLDNTSTLSVLVTLLAIAIAYDQGTRIMLS